MTEVCLCTDLRRVSSGTARLYESALTKSLRSSFEQSPWLTAAEQLALFPTKRCVQMKPEDWQELSAVLGSITRQCATAKSCSKTTVISIEQGSSNPKFVAILELLLRLGQVTSCLLCVNGDDRSFSIARVAQVCLYTFLNPLQQLTLCLGCLAPAQARACGPEPVWQFQHGWCASCGQHSCWCRLALGANIHPAVRTA
jgi:hypothetical protein